MKPVIILGMHRSGTSFLAEILQDLGLFIGKDLNVHSESKSFLELNDFILSIAHTYWDYPLTVKQLFDDDLTTDMLMENLRKKIRHASFKNNFWGRRNIFWNKRDPQIWGWKEPRTMATFPIWYKIFPDAKFLFIYRNGIDVAQSLYRREIDRHGKIKNKIYSVRCINFKQCFKLWEEYNGLYEENKYIIPQNQLLSFSYESLLENPSHYLCLIAQYIGIESFEKKIEMNDLKSKFDKTKRYKFREIANLKEFYLTKKDSPLMVKYGYGDLL